MGNVVVGFFGVFFLSPRFCFVTPKEGEMGITKMRVRV